MNLLQLGYKIICCLLFLLPAETGHKLALTILKILYKLKILCLFLPQQKHEELRLAGLIFKNKLGLAAGLDKNGDYIAPLACLGVGFIELGTVTPLPQNGNPKPRLFRLKSQQAVINRMGFNNKGIDYLIAKIQKYKSHLSSTDAHEAPLIGINIGKNFNTPVEQALDDYLLCLKKAYIHADYITINISSPNTQNLRDLQNKDHLANLLDKIKEQQLKLAELHNKYTPLALKIAPDLSEQQISTICDLCKIYKIEFIIATNTTNEHELLYDNLGNKIAGGLSGRPLFSKSNNTLKQIVQNLHAIPAEEQALQQSSTQEQNIALIGVGGISSADDAQIKLTIGADLIQIYTGLVYQGPSLIIKILQRLHDANKKIY